MLCIWAISHQWFSNWQCNAVAVIMSLREEICISSSPHPVTHRDILSHFASPSLHNHWNIIYLGSMPLNHASRRLCVRTAVEQCSMFGKHCSMFNVVFDIWACSTGSEQMFDVCLAFVRCVRLRSRSHLVSELIICPCSLWCCVFSVRCSRSIERVLCSIGCSSWTFVRVRWTLFDRSPALCA